ncbi:MAG TPA: hypothetical protein VIK64_17220 [Anaerolineales bacterium]
MQDASYRLQATENVARGRGERRLKADGGRKRRLGEERRVADQQIVGSRVV